MRVLSLQARFQHFAAGDRVLRGGVGVVLAADGRLKHALAIDENFDPVRLLEAARHLHAVAREHDFEGVFAIQREVMPNH